MEKLLESETTTILRALILSIDSSTRFLRTVSGLVPRFLKNRRRKKRNITCVRKEPWDGFGVKDHGKACFVISSPSLRWLRKL